MNAIKKITATTLASVCAVGMSANLMAKDAPNVYVGGGYGQYKFEFENDDIDTDFDDSSDVIKVFVGSELAPGIAVELGYHDFGDTEQGPFEANLEGVSIGGKFGVPVTHFMTLYGNLGWFFWDADVEGTFLDDVTPISFSESYDGNDVFYGAGAKFDVSERVAIRVEYNRYELDDEIDPELDIFSVSGQVAF